MELGILPINISKILDGRTIENSRLEYKEGWNPERILHTICAFANDYDNIGGGYIIIGIREDGGLPAEFPGVTPEEIAKIDRELMRLCNYLEPRYMPRMSQETYRGVTLCVIWAPPGESRPYTCPVSLGDDKSRERAYYIRRLSNMVRANHDEEVALIRGSSSKTTFDNSVNGTATIADISWPYVSEYLTSVGSNIDLEMASAISVYRAMGIVRGPSDFPRPVNVGLMMFSMHPEEFFPKTYAEVSVINQDSGEVMRDVRFTGPVAYQIQQIMMFLNNGIIGTITRKRSDRTEAETVVNYPVVALREVVVNAYFHRDYEIQEPVKVRIYSDMIAVISYPGLDRSITRENMDRGDFRCDYCRNSRLGDYLKEMDLAEMRNSGIPMVFKAMRENGSPQPRFITDDDRRSIRVELPIHPYFLEDEPPSDDQATNIDRDVGRTRTPDEIKDGILEVLRERGCTPSSEISKALGYSRITGTFRRCLNELMDQGLIEYKYPDKPNDKRQKICLVSRHP